VVDHHVDRPGVDAQQCVQLTGPNRSIGSFLRARKRAAAEPVAHSGKNREVRDKPFVIRDANDRRLVASEGSRPVKTMTPAPHEIRAALPLFALRRADGLDMSQGSMSGLMPGFRFDGLVATARGNTPDPIPNSAVKTLSANGTAS
jgi:hypothetical protein